MYKEIITISSPDNALVKDIVRLQTPKERNSKGLFIAEGKRTIIDLANCRINIVYLFATKEQIDFAKAMGQDNTIIVETTAGIINKLSPSVSPSGVLGVCAIPKYNDHKLVTPGLVLAQIQDPGNMGTLIRSAAALGIKNVVVVEGTDPWGPKVIQASAGTIGRIPIIELSWSELVAKTRANNIDLCALSVKGGQSPTNLQKNQLLVVGNEAHGLSDEWQVACQTTVTIPMPGNIDSLNAAVAGSIALYLLTNH
jgi:RNA methyltransferase, TrmH family